MNKNHWRVRLAEAGAAISCLQDNEGAADKVRYTWASLAAERLAEVRDEIGERIGKTRTARIKIEDLPIEKDGD